MFSQKNLQLCTYWWVPNDINKASDSAFTANIALETHQLLALASRSRWRGELTSCWFASTNSYSVIVVITRKLWSELLFRPELYVTHDVIRSNLVLIVFTLHRSLLQTFLNVQKSLSSHAKISLTSQLFKSVKFYLARKCRGKRWKYIFCQNSEPFLRNRQKS